MEKVLVTGGLGMVGAFVCRALLATNRQPVIYDAGSDTRLIRDILADCVVEIGNTCDLPRLMGAVSHHRPVAIAHLAGEINPRVEQFPWSSIHANVVGTTTVFECARFSGIQRIVFASSRTVYGPVEERYQHPNYEPVPEEHPREPLKLYGKLKRAGEDVADHYARLYDLDIVGLRFGSTFGPGKFGRHNRVSPVMGLIEAAITNRPFVLECGAEQCDDLCYTGEAANGFIAALGSPARPGKFRAYNISSGEAVSLGEIITILRNLYPSWNAAAGPGLDYRRIGLHHYFRMSIQKAGIELGFRPLFDFRRAAIHYAETVGRLFSIAV